MEFTEVPRYEFSPGVGDNLKLPEIERFTVEIIRPTGEMRAEFTKLESSREFYPDDQPVDEKGKPRTVKKFKSITTAVRYDAGYILRNCVGYVKNCTVKRIGKDGKEKEVTITTGKELADSRAYGLSPYLDAICTEVNSDRLSGAKKKYLE